MAKKTYEDYYREYIRVRDNAPNFKYASEDKKRKIQAEQEKKLKKLQKLMEEAKKAEEAEKQKSKQKQKEKIEKEKNAKLLEEKKQREKIEREKQYQREKLEKEKKQKALEQKKKLEKEKKEEEKQQKKIEKLKKQKEEKKLAREEAKRKENINSKIEYIDEDENQTQIKDVNQNQKISKNKNKIKIESESETKADDYAQLYEEENEKISFRPKHLLRYIILVLVIVGFGFVIANFQNIAPSGVVSYIEDLFSAKPASNKNTIDVAGINILSAHKTSKDVIILSDTSLLNYSKTGGLQFDRQHGYTAPRVKTSDTYILTYDHMSNRFRVDSRSKNIINKSISKNIIAADISDNKRIAIVTESEGYAAELNIYDFSLERKNFRWYSAENDVIDISLSPDGKKAAVITIGSKAGEFISYLTVLDFSKEKPVSKTEYLNSILVSVDFKTNSEVTVVGDNICSVVPINNAKKKVDYYFEDSSLVNFDSSQRGTLLALQKYSDITKTDLVFISQKGNVYFEELLDYSILSVSLNGRRSFAITKDKLLEVDIRGKIIKEKDHSVESNKLLNISGNSFIIGNSSIIIE
jgi:hypothetical protein